MTRPWAYFDTSVLAKLYVNEPGSPQARILRRQYQCLTSDLSPVETVSALSRRRAHGELSERSFAAIMARFENDRARWELIVIGDLLLREAEEVIKVSGVKTLDAIHIASALQFRATSGIRIPFISADERQLEAAAAFGLRIERGSFSR